MKTADIITYDDICHDEDFDIEKCLYAIGTTRQIKAGDLSSIRQGIALKFGKYQTTRGACGPMLIPSTYWHASTSLAMAVTQKFQRWRDDGKPVHWVIDTITPGTVLMPWAQFLEIRKAKQDDFVKHEKAKQAVEKERRVRRTEVITLLGLPGGNVNLSTHYSNGEPRKEWSLTVSGPAFHRMVGALPTTKRKKIEKLLVELQDLKDPDC